MAASASKLPQDLIDEVLLRLPAKSVGRFRCVSKPWRSLLSSSKFVKSHLDFHIKSGATTLIVAVSPNEEDESPIFPHLLTFTADGSSKKVTSPIFGRGGIGLYGACHGFVLIGTKFGMFVFNPVTLKAQKVPKFRLPKKFKCCSDQWGFGYDSSNDDYKVVRLSYYDRYSFCDRDYDGTYVDVYSLKKKSWSRIGNSPYDHHDMPYPCPVAYANGRLHWQAEDRNKYVIAAFNLAREEFEEVPPPTKDFEEGDGLVTAFGGCFALECSCIDIWVMKVYGVPKLWNKLSINIQDKIVMFVCLSREDELVFRENDVVPGTEKLVAYSLSSGLWRDIIVDGIPSRFGQEGVQPFTECLLSPMEEECL